MSCDFSTTVTGKWILAGEHAVLRGCSAVIFPLPTRTLSLAYWQSDEPVRAEFGGNYMKEPQLLFWAMLEKALEMLQKSHNDISGKFYFQNNIPVSSGMGASAALCVAMGHWFVWRGWIEESNLYEFARELEDLFHGESSGADIAAVITGEGINFSKASGWQPLPVQWQPKWFLSYSGHVGITSQCIDKVKSIWQSDASHAQAIDHSMQQSVKQATKALQLKEADGFPLLVEAINKALDCFRAWGLIDNNSEHHIEQLRRDGAYAAKPTGSGDGGFILSLWPKPPPKSIDYELIPV